MSGMDSSCQTGHFSQSQGRAAPSSRFTQALYQTVWSHIVVSEEVLLKRSKRCWGHGGLGWGGGVGVEVNHVGGVMTSAEPGALRSFTDIALLSRPGKHEAKEEPQGQAPARLQPSRRSTIDTDTSGSYEFSLLDCGWQRRESTRPSLWMIKANFFKDYKRIWNSEHHARLLCSRAK